MNVAKICYWTSESVDEIVAVINRSLFPKLLLDARQIKKTSLSPTSILTLLILVATRLMSKRKDRRLAYDILWHCKQYLASAIQSCIMKILTQSFVLQQTYLLLQNTLKKQYM